MGRELDQRNASMHNFAYGPFPSTLRADERGAYFESCSEDGMMRRYVVIRAKRFMSDRARELLTQGVTMEELYPQLERLGRAPSPDAHWLYEVESSSVPTQHHANVDDFVDHTEDFRARLFDDYVEVMAFCEHEFGLHESDFKKQWETHYVS